MKQILWEPRQEPDEEPIEDDEQAATFVARHEDWLLNAWLEGDGWLWDVQGVTEETDDDLREGKAPDAESAMKAAELACRELAQVTKD